MSKIVFVPVSDELLFEHPERIVGPLVPYHPGMRVGATPNAVDRHGRGVGPAQPTAPPPARRPRRP